MKSAIELFSHELRDMLNAEAKLAHALAEQEMQSSRPQLAQAFQHHRKQTEQQAVRLLDIFRELGEVPEQGDCKGVSGLLEEKQNFMKHDPSPELLDFFNCCAAVKAERYEISAYETLIALARQLGLQNAVQRLQQTQAEEQQTLEKMIAFSHQCMPSELGVLPGKIEGGRPRKAA